MQVVATSYEHHEESTTRYKHIDIPTTDVPLGKRDDDKHDAGDHCAHSIQQRFLLPISPTVIAPVHHHAGLANRESKEDTNCVGRNQERDDRTRCKKADNGPNSNRDDCASIRKSITPLPNLPRQESIASHDSCELWPAVEACVCGKEQNPSRCNLIDDIEDAIAE